MDHTISFEDVMLLMFAVKRWIMHLHTCRVHIDVYFLKKNNLLKYTRKRFMIAVGAGGLGTWKIDEDFRWHVSVRFSILKVHCKKTRSIKL